jgi:hypothetical protein
MLISLNDKRRSVSASDCADETTVRPSEFSSCELTLWLALGGLPTMFEQYYA